MTRGLVFFNCCVSNPCFEYWYLLHYKFTTAPYNGNAGFKSSGNLLKKELGKHIKGYTENYPDIYKFLLNEQDDAIRHAKRAMTIAENNGCFNPSTMVHELVEKLINLHEN
ncbi:RloB family protein [Vreelandella aquamarina]|uniref:RloB family protein n=1 Tax=Vreelandella aquamarina TaxID=77097 RepID=UPI00384FD529